MTKSELPNGWVKTTLGSVIEPKRVKADPRATPNAKFIGMEHVEPHTTRLLGTTTAGAMKSSANAFKRGDVLYGRLRPYLNKVHQPDFDGLCSGEFIVMPENHAVSGAFLKYRLNTQDFVDFASHLNAGDRPRVDFGQLQSFSLALPPKSEQTRIAHLLDELSDDLTTGVNTLERCREKLELYRASVLKAAVEGDLTADWRTAHPDIEPASTLLQRILTERRERWEREQLRAYADKGKTPPNNWKAKYKEPASPELISCRPLPRHWCWASLEQLAWSSSYGTSIKCKPDNVGLAIARIPNIIDGTVDLNDLKFAPKEHVERPDRLIAAGDMLVIRTNGSRNLIGRSAFVSEEPRVPMSFASYLIRFRLVAFIHWLSLIWDSDLVRQWLENHSATSAGQYNIALSTLNRLPLPIPPCEEQTQIAAEMQKALAGCKELGTTLPEQIAGAQRVRHAVLHDAFAGKLLPQDPTDEPASRLLERIAAARSPQGG